MELLSPAGNFDKMKAAIAFGADAVYFGGPLFGLRAFAGNFDYDEIAEAVKYLHERGKKGYLTVNIYASDSETAEIETYLKRCEALGVDGFIISDPGIFAVARAAGIRTPISISTQANTTNLSAVNFWATNGAERVILAREVKKNDLENIVKGAKCEVEVFIHGAICISMSGRCLISAYMTGRDANKGECTHPCRWNYALMEETREGSYYPVYEDERGSYLYNSKDLCLLDRIGELTAMGVKSGKVEGRMKSVMYVSVVTGVYRAAIDRAMKDGVAYKPDPFWRFLLERISNRGYIEGFYGSQYDADAINSENSGYNRQSDFLGVVESCTQGEAVIACRAKFKPNDKVSFLTPQLKKIDVNPSEIFDIKKGENTEATRPNFEYKIAVPENLPEGTLLMRFIE